MARGDRNLRKEMSELRRLLEDQERKTGYFQKIAEETGRKRLREIDQLSTLIRKHQEAEEALRESELRFRSLFDFSPQAMALLDFEDGGFLEVNDRFCDLTRYSREELLGTTLGKSDLCSPQDLLRLMEELRGAGKVEGYKMDVRVKDGSDLHVLIFGRLIHIGGRISVVATLVDLTHQQLLESKLMHAQKMEALGTLAGGIAHDFNNLLMAIQGNVTLALLGLGPSHPQFKTLQSVENLTKSGAKLTGRLLGYARKGKYEARVLELNQLVRNTSETFAGMRKDVRVQREFSGDLFPAEVDQGQMEQVLLNLFINAGDAMPDGGSLFLRTANVTYEAVKRRVYAPKPGNYVLIEVTDTGKGMDEATKSRIFEPFFTTKEIGKGTGLGLASVFGIIKAHGGYIDFESALGRGTTFSIFLPATEKQFVRASDERKRNIREGNGTILMVDDEERVLCVCGDLVRSLGYKVLEARGGREALDLYKGSKEEVDLVILDMVMPDMNGRETYEHMKRINPGQKILLCSGYSPDSHVKEMLNRGCDGFIQKPYDLTELSGKIRRILNAAVTSQ